MKKKMMKKKKMTQRKEMKKHVAMEALSSKQVEPPSVLSLCLSVSEKSWPWQWIRRRKLGDQQLSFRKIFEAELIPCASDCGYKKTFCRALLQMTVRHFLWSSWNGSESIQEAGRWGHGSSDGWILGGSIKDQRPWILCRFIEIEGHGSCVDRSRSKAMDLQ